MDGIDLAVISHGIVVESVQHSLGGSDGLSFPGMHLHQSAQRQSRPRGTVVAQGEAPFLVTPSGQRDRRSIARSWFVGVAGSPALGPGLS